MKEKFPLTRNAFIGFDHIFDELQRISSHAKDAYPPYNVVKLSDDFFVIELAVAGFSKEDITVTTKDHILTISGDRELRRDPSEYVHHGISTRKFTKSLRISEYTDVVGADLVDGILSVNLRVRVPKGTEKVINIT